MPREDEEVAVEVLDVGLHVRNGLSAVDDGNGTDGMSFGDDVLDRTLHAEDVADGSEGNDLGLVVDLSQIFVREVAFFIEVHEFQDGTSLFADPLPGDQVGMVFRNGDDDLVALFQFRFGIAAGNEVQGFRRIADEDDFFRRRSVDEAADGLTSFVVQFAGFDAEDVSAAVRIAIVMFEEIYDGVDDLTRFLRRSGVIKVNDGMSVMDFSQDWEIFAYI